MQHRDSEIQAWDVEDSFEKELAGHTKKYVTRFLRLYDKIYVLVGSERDYLLVEGLYCSCPLFQRNVINGKAYCHHLAGLKTAIEKGLVVDANVDVAVARRVVAEILAAGFSVEVRKLLHSNRS